jgi:hypothetical protein
MATPCPGVASILIVSVVFVLGYHKYTAQLHVFTLFYTVYFSALVVKCKKALIIRAFKQITRRSKEGAK